MRKDKVTDALYAAEMFLRTGKALMNQHFVEKRPNDQALPAGKAAAACKRASMDLTRALAEMRKP